MEPIGSWSAYAAAASYNRLTNPNFQTSQSEHAGQGGTTPGASAAVAAAAAASAPQLLLQAHASSNLGGTTASPFTPSGFLSPSPVTYDSVFTPLFHQKSHYRSLKQPEAETFNNAHLSGHGSNFFDQTAAWSPNNQLPSPFGVLPHESVISNPGMSKPYDNFNHFNSLNPPSSNPPKLPAPAVTAPKNPTFFQQSPPVNDYSKFQTNPPPLPPPACSETLRPPRLPPSCEQPMDYTPAGVAKPPLSAKTQDVLNQGQSSPISYAMMDSQRNYPNAKMSGGMEQQYQDFRYSNSSEYLSQNAPNKPPTVPSYNSPSSSRTPSSASPAYPMYHSPVTASPSPVGQVDSGPPCYGTKIPAYAPSVITRTSSEKPYVNRFEYDKQWDRDRRYLGTFDSTHSRPYGPELLEPPGPTTTPTCLQDLSSCREDPMSLVKTLQAQQSLNLETGDPASDDEDDEEDDEDENDQPAVDSPLKLLQRRKSEELTQLRDPHQMAADCLVRIPPPAHHNIATSSQQLQSGCFDYDRWGVAASKPYSSAPPANFVPSIIPPAVASAPLLPPPLVAPTSTSPSSSSYSCNVETIPPTTSSPCPTSPSQPTPQVDVTYPSAFHAPSPVVQPSKEPETPQETLDASEPKETADDGIEEEEETHTTSPTETNLQDIEDELSFLADENFQFPPDVVDPPPQPAPVEVSPKPSSSFDSSYMKFIRGEPDEDPTPNPRVVKRVRFMEPSSSTFSFADHPSIRPKINYSDPRDDPRYFPLPKNPEDRCLDTSDDDEGAGNVPGGEQEEVKKVPKVRIILNSELLRSINKKKKSSKKKRKKRRKHDDSDGESEKVPKKRNSKNKSHKKAKPLPSEVPGPVDSTIEPEGDSDSGGGKRRSLRTSARVNKSYVEKDDDDEDESNLKVPWMSAALKARLNSQRAALPVLKPVYPQIEKPKAVVSPIQQQAVADHSVCPEATPSFPFNHGDFLILRSDRYRLHPPLWLVQNYKPVNSPLLNKCEHHVTKGVVYYSSVKFYVGWSPAGKNVYEKVDVKCLTTNNKETLFKLLSTNLLVVSSGKDIVEDAMKENLRIFENFEVYIQTFFSQALDSNFLLEIFQEKDEYFLSSIRTIEAVQNTLLNRLIGALDWPETAVHSILKLPSYHVGNVVPSTLPSVCLCGKNFGGSGSRAVSVYGQTYRMDTLVPTEESYPPLEITFCSTCLEYFETLHKLAHQKCSLYALCEEKVAAKKREDFGKDSTFLLNELLSDDFWLNQVFSETNYFWGFVEKLIQDIEKVKRLALPDSAR